MGTNAPDEVTMATANEDSDTTVAIRIKTLDSQTYTMRVDKCVPVPALKEQIATVTGVLSEQQRLICRGKVLRDDQLLSEYHVEDGHTLHLVSRLPVPPANEAPGSSLGFEDASIHQAFHSASSNAHNHGNHVAHDFIIEAVNIDQGNRSTSGLTRLISDLYNTIANASIELGNARTVPREANSEMPGNTVLPGDTHPRSSSTAPRVDLDSQQAASRIQSVPQHPAAIPDSLTTIEHYLHLMRQEFMRERFSVSGGEHYNNAEGSSEGQNHDFQPPVLGQGALPSPASLAEILLSTRELLIEQYGGCLSELARQLETQASVTDPLMRANIQSNAMRYGSLLQNLGSFLLELGRTTMTLCMGQSPVEAVVNAGPAVFISASGPNPMMVQPIPFYPGSNFGRIHMGSVNSGNGLERLPRNTELRFVRRGLGIPVTTANLDEQTGAQQTQQQTDSVRNFPGANFFQAFSGSSGSASLTGGPEVRVVPIRRVIAVPASDSSGRPAGLFYPLIARIQQQSSRNADDARGSQSSSEPHHGVDRQTTVESAIPRTDGNHLPTNPTPVVSGLSFTTNEPAQYQGSSGAFIASDNAPAANSNDSSQVHDGQETGQASMAQMFSRLNQWFRSVLTGEEINVSGIGQHESVGGSATYQTGTTRNFEALGISDDGVFFSNLVRQLMPYISHGTATETGVVSPTNPNSSRAQSEGDNSADANSSSQHRRDPPDAPNSKRTKRE